MTEQEKSKYIELSVADRRRHLEQCQQMKDKGYFITDDGRISSEILQIKKEPRIKSENNVLCLTWNRKFFEIKWIVRKMD